MERIMDSMVIKALNHQANQIRNHVLEMCIHTGGHIVSSFSSVEILVSLYHGNVLNIDPRNPDSEERDRFILSKGHAETALYAVLADCGFFPAEWIEKYYRKDDCRLGGHPDRKIPGVEINSGALGHGLGIGAGIAWAAIKDGKTNLQFVLMGDAECMEGSVWEAAQFAATHELNNLVAIVDWNRIGSLDFTKNYSKLEPFAEKWNAFGWDTQTIDGHSFEELINTFQDARSRTSVKPLLIIAETIKGKGVSFMENDPTWHVRAITDEIQITQAREELRWRGDDNC